MIKSATATSLIVLMLALSPSAAQAESIKDQVPDTTLAEYCSSVGVGTKTAASLELPDGTKVTGTIECEAEDLIVGDEDELEDELDDDLEDDDSEDDDSEDDDSEDDDSEDDDSEDDDSSDDDSSDDDSSDDSDDSEDD